MFMEVLLVELVHTWHLNTLRCLYRQHGTCCAWGKGLNIVPHTFVVSIKEEIYTMRYQASHGKSMK